jgi:hypothetical protein
MKKIVLDITCIYKLLRVYVPKIEHSQCVPKKINCLVEHLGMVDMLMCLEMRLKVDRRDDV